MGKSHLTRIPYLIIFARKQPALSLGGIILHGFTSDIPFSAGPYKFGGLPGLIVKIADETNDYEWSLRSFTRAASDETIKLYKWPYQSISRAKMADIVRRMNNNPYMFLESIGAKFHVGNSDSYSYISLPYNPIELDLEQKNK
jgi:hypothetical protein